MNRTKFDIAIIGGGIIGTATAMALLKDSDVNLAVIESESRLAYHQSGHNSGVIHSGIYYKPGSLKARLCFEGREALYDFCREHDIPHERCGKIIVATSDDEIESLENIEKRGIKNGLENIVRLDSSQIKEYEPGVSGAAGLHVPQTGIVDYVKVVETYARLIRERGGKIFLDSRVTRINTDSEGIKLTTATGEYHTRHLINCAGLYSDRVARMAGVAPGIQIIPFRGEYYTLLPDKANLIKNLVYPVPDPKFPFLGVHFTRTISGGIEAGPNAVLAFKRDAYKKTDFSFLETANIFLNRGFWNLARKYWKTGLGEFHRSLNKAAFTRELQRLLPALREDDMVPAEAGVRAQAMEPDGTLVDDFRIVEAENMIHVLNAPSPAATASIKIGEYIADIARNRFEMN